MNDVRDSFFYKLAGEQVVEDAMERIDRLDVAIDPMTGYDEFGYSREFLKKVMPVGMFFYKKWFRVEVKGIENVPATGPAIIVPNHGGQLPLDGAMVMLSNLMEPDKPRLCRAMVEKWIPTLPYMSVFMLRVGQAVGVTENADKFMEHGELMVIFPEGVRGSGKTWDKRYQVQDFTLGFMELAIKHGAPIIPCAVVGSEEQAPALINAEKLAKTLNMPYFPITPTFPLFGALGLLPLPSKYRIHFGAPMDFSDKQADLDDPDLIGAHVETVRARVQEMVDQGRRERFIPGL